MMKPYLRHFLIVAAVFLSSVAFCAEPLYRPLPLVGVDLYGRTVQPIKGYDDSRQVGLFFFLSIGQPYADGIFDATEIMKRPDGRQHLFFQSDSLSPTGNSHFWGKPLWGYYNSDDEWVIRRQIEMLTMAGVDFLVFDATNAVTYKEVYMKVLSVIDEYRKAGWKAPQIAFYTHSLSLQTVCRLYDDLYHPSIYPDTWYRVDGKPLIIAYTYPSDDIAEARSRGDNSYNPEPLPSAILDFFHFRMPQWPFDPVKPDGFAWIEWIFPQPLHTDMMSVTVASHPNVPFSFSLTRGAVNWGRGWNPDIQRNVSEDVNLGTFFQRQWDHAIEVSPPTVFVCGWNEWTALKQLYKGEYMLCDQATREFSRDIEPMCGEFEDAFYLQLMRNIRRYKGFADSTTHNAPHTIGLTHDARQWDDVPFRCINMGVHAVSRDSYGAARTVRYTQNAPSNTLSEVRVTHDKHNVYFMLQWRDAFSLTDTTMFPRVLISTGRVERKGWEGYEFEVSTLDLSLERLDPSGCSTRVGRCRWSLRGNLIQIAVSRRLIGLKSDGQFYFKVAAGVSDFRNIMDYYRSGSVMPLGRLSYLYRF